MTMKKMFLFISALLAGGTVPAQEVLLSPDGDIRMQFSITDAP